MTAPDEKPQTLPTTQEVKQAIAEFGTAVAELRKTNDERLARLEKGLGGVAELDAKITKLNGIIDQSQGIKDQVARIELALKRLPVGSAQEQADPAKAEAIAEYKTALLHYCKTGMPPKNDVEAMRALSIKSMSVASEPNGGYFVTPEQSNRLIKRIFETSPMRAVATVVPIGSGALEGFYDDDECGAEWEEEVESNAVNTTPTIGKWSIPVHIIRSRLKVSQTLLDDAMINIETWLTDHASRKFARKEATAFVTGDGIKKPRGFATYTHSATYARERIEQVDVSDTGALAADGLIDLIYTLKSEWRARAAVAANRSTWGKVRLLKDDDNQYLWQPSYQAGQPAQLLGLPTVEFNDMADVSSNTLPIAVADWAEAYTIVDRIGFTVMRNPFCDEPYVRFTCRRRVGGQVVNFDAIKIGKIGTP